MSKPYIIGIGLLLAAIIIYWTRPTVERKTATRASDAPVWKCIVNESPKGLLYVCQRISAPHETFSNVKNPSTTLTTIGFGKQSSIPTTTSFGTGLLTSTASGSVGSSGSSTLSLTMPTTSLTTPSIKSVGPILTPTPYTLGGTLTPTNVPVPANSGTTPAAALPTAALPTAPALAPPALAPAALTPPAVQLVPAPYNPADLLQGSV